MGWMRWLQRLIGSEQREAPRKPPPSPTITPAPARERAPAREYPRGAFHPGLFAALRVDPDDAERFAVLGDWLVEQGDPRGHVVLAMQGGALPVDLLEEHAVAMYGPLHGASREHVGPDAPLRRAHLRRYRDEPVVSMVAGWRHGFVDRLWVRAIAGDTDWVEETDPPVAAVRAFLDHPSCWVLRDLTLAGSHVDPAVAPGTYPTVRRLRIGDFIAGEECELSWSECGDWSAVRQRFPDATDITVQGGFDALDLPDGVRSFTLQSATTRPEVVRAVLARADAMRHLELWTGDGSYYGEVTLADLHPLHDLQLDHLGLRNSELSDAFVAWLVTTPLAGRLKTLDLSLGTLTDAGAATLARGRDAFGRLERLDLHDNAVDAQAEALGAAFGDALHLGDQKDEPYVSVSE